MEIEWIRFKHLLTLTIGTALLVLISGCGNTVQENLKSGECKDELKGFFESKRGNRYLCCSGKVTKLLEDDRMGTPHQRFILQISDNQTVLIAHNTQLAPRIPNLNIGDRIEFCGEYEWNKKGGVIHWTHFSDNFKHPHGYLLRNGIKYD